MTLHDKPGKAMTLHDKAGKAMTLHDKAGKAMTLHDKAGKAMRPILRAITRFNIPTKISIKLFNSYVCNVMQCRELGRND